MITVVIGKIIHGVVVLGRSYSILEMDGKMMMGLSIYGVAVISRSLYSRFYGRRKKSIQEVAVNSSRFEFSGVF